MDILVAMALIIGGTVLFTYWGARALCGTTIRACNPSELKSIFTSAWICAVSTR